MTVALLTQIEEKTKAYIDPCLGLPLGQTKTQIDVRCVDKVIQVDLQFPYPISMNEASLQLALQQMIQTLTDLPILVNLSWRVLVHAIAPTIQPMPNVKNVIPVASGKGGVGKSTMTVNLAVALAQMGARVGILDADIYGPNQPQMLGVTDERPVVENNKLHPLVRYGVQTASIGYLVDAAQPMIWRGPMVSQALQQLANETAWDNLDYLFIDLPPGTGDIQLTLSQKIPVSGALIVTTPQEIALADARKGLAMFRKVKVPVLGVVENMSYHVCLNCDEKHYLFGQNGGRKMAEQFDVPFLGEVPLVTKIREQADKGVPIVISDSASQIAKHYADVAQKLAARLALQAKGYQVKLPGVTVVHAEK